MVSRELYYWVFAVQIRISWFRALCRQINQVTRLLMNWFRLRRITSTPNHRLLLERYKFNSHVRQQGQAVAVFIAELRRLAHHCDYGETLNDMLRDRLVCGINDDRIQRRLLSESSLQFQKAWEMARAMELAEKNVKDTEIVSVSPAQLQSNKLSGTRHKVKRQGKQQAPSQPHGSTNKCYRCGRTDHTAQNCRSGKPTQTPNKFKHNTYNIEGNVDCEESAPVASNYTMYKTSSQTKVHNCEGND